MPHSEDEFGLDDDDTAFLDAASQIESGFEASSRPAKRRRTAQSNDTGIEARGKPAEDLDYYFPGELESGPSLQKASNARIHIPQHNRQFQDLIFTQTQRGLDQNPAVLRGPIWKRPPLAAKSQSPNVTAKLFPKPNAALNGIGSYFKPAAKPANTAVDDVLFATSLQANENQIAQVVPDYTRPQPPKTRLPDDFDKELDDLPSDAFSSQLQETECILISSQLTASQSAPAGPAGLRAPQHGLKQMTMFGQPATQAMTASQTATKRHAWPLKTKEEPPTHHKLNDKAMETWVYPTNLGTIRDYQFNIVSRSLYHNTLVALPTGLGKTFIAATVMLNYYRWTTTSQIVFMAPTKPLIAQQMEACYQIVGMPRRDTVLMTGETTPGLRAEEWNDRRVFFMTPQTVVNDLKTGICDPKRIVLLVVDEAHKATGGYAYTEVVAFMRRFNSSFRVLALTATPGSNIEAVQAVISNLSIARVELRTEQSIDIVQFTHEKQIQTEIFEYSDEQVRIMDMFAKALKPVVDKLCSQNAYWGRDPMTLTAYGLTQARKKWMMSDAGRKAPMPIKGMVNSQFTVLSSLAHSISMLKFHGIVPFYSGVSNFQKEVDGGKTKSKAAVSIAQSKDFVDMMSILRTWTNNPDFLGHPKLEHLRRVILNHFMDAGEGRHGSDVSPNKTRVMVFASFRDSTEEICRVLKRSEPMIRPHVFVGQAASKGSEGMDQRRQNAVIQDFKAGKYNTLVATSIGEEGLDIGDVDLIVNYDASASPIRMLQRIGRTGRKRIGHVSLLLMKDKEEKDYAKAQDNYLYIQKTIADSSKYTYRDDESPRILPKSAQPVVDKRNIDIPVENTQPIDLNERNRKRKSTAKVKRPPKKFHMPDNVRTGFTTASKLGREEHDDDDDNDDSDLLEKLAGPSKKVSTKKATPKKKPEKPGNTKPKRTLAAPTSDLAPLPFLQDVLLSDLQQADLMQKYARAAASDDPLDHVIRAPDASRFPERLRDLGQTKFVGHGTAARRVERTMRLVHSFDDDRVDRLKGLLNMEDLTSVPADILYSPSSAAKGSIANPRVTAIKPRNPQDVGLQRTSMVPELLSDDTHSEAELPSAHAAPKSKPAKPRESRKQQDAGPRRASTVREPLSDDGQSEAELPSVRRAAKSKPTATRKPPRPKAPKKAHVRPILHGSSAPEGDESSPAPTPAELRIPTQGIDLGSRDTSGEDDDDEELDSELAAFIAKSSDAIEMMTSSQHVLSSARTPARRKAPRKRKEKTHPVSVVEVNDSDDDLGRASDASIGDELSVLGDDDEGVEDSHEEGVKGPEKLKSRKRAIVEDDSDE